MIKALAFFFLFFSAIALFAQQEITISGTVSDEITSEPIPYSTIIVVAKADGATVAGASSDFDGNFSFRSPAADVELHISFIGYEKKIIDILPSGGKLALGTIALSRSVEALDEVEITAEKSRVEFQLDKRVFHVGKDISSTGAGAMDVLNSVPSVNVNLEGQVSLRGNAGVQILINGKPSVLADGTSNALGSITADMIESIEVITNPSAKYNAEGTSGIINIILKKEEKKGLNGSISVNTGIPDNHSIGGSFNLRREKLNLFAQLGAGYRSMPSFSRSINRNQISGDEIRSEGTEYRNEVFYNFTLGADYYINDLNKLTLAGNYALELESQPSEFVFNDFVAGATVADNAWTRTEETSATNPKWQFDLQYEKKFEDDKDHVLQFSTLGSFFGKDQNSDFANRDQFGLAIVPDQRTEANFYQEDYTFKLDYVDPISDKITIELGSQYDINDVGNEYAVFNDDSGVWVPDSAFTNNFIFNQKVLGVYGTAAYELKKWGVKVGLRVEDTDLKTKLVTTGQENDQLYTNLFPTFHTSYKFTPLFSLQAGYSRRIYRPRLWDLNPFFNIRNNFNIRMGNPELKPEYADSYELTGILILEKVSLNAGVYHLFTTSVIERVSFPENNVNITRPENIGTRSKYGVEVNGKYTPTAWMTINGDFNYGQFYRSGSFLDQNFDFNANQWNARMTMKFGLPKSIDLELTGNIESDVQTVQGQTSGFAYLDAGLRKKIKGGRAIVNFAVRDIFTSRINESTAFQNDYYVYNHSMRGRFFTLGFSYSFGKGEAMTYSGRMR
jgi:outer membrane receptor protein involved in Fe transport